MSAQLTGGAAIPSRLRARRLVVDTLDTTNDRNGNPRGAFLLRDPAGRVVAVLPIDYAHRDASRLIGACERAGGCAWREGIALPVAPSVVARHLRGAA